MKKEIVALIGGGHTHALVLKEWAKQPLPHMELHVFDPQPKVAYTGMLPGFVSGHYKFDDLLIDLQALTKAAGGTFHEMAVEMVDPISQTIKTKSETFSFDIISFDVGVYSAAKSFPGSSEHGVGVKPLTPFAHRWQSFVSNHVHANSSARVVVIGGGVAGVEVALAMAYRLRYETGRFHKITIIEHGELLSAVSLGTKRTLINALKKHKVEIRTQETVQCLTRSAVLLDGAPALASDLVLMATGPQPYDWVSEIGLPVTNGYIDVDATLRSPKYPRMFAVGDCAHFLPRPLPKAGVYAVREAQILHHNICGLVNHTKLRSYETQNDYLKLISLGEKRAVADKWGLTISGLWLWKLKDRIDERFMSQFG